MKEDQETVCNLCGWKNGWHNNGCADSKYSDAELEQIKIQHKNSVEKAMDIAQKSGVSKHPKIIAARARLAIAMANGNLMRGENVSYLSDEEFIKKVTSTRST